VRPDSSAPPSHSPPLSDRPAIVVTRRLPPTVEERLTELFDARFNPDDVPLSPEQLADAMRSADGLLCTLTDRIGADLLNTPLRQVRILANFGVGYTNIDVKAAKAAGIVVTNTPDVLTDDTADLTIALMLMVARRLGEGERLVRDGKWTGWRPTDMLATSLTGKTLGIIGMGRIGRAVARRASGGLGMSVTYYNPSAMPADAAATLGAERKDSIEAVLDEADVLTLHCPSTPQTHHLINAPRLTRMRNTAFLINTSRGDVVDESALIEALRAGQIAGAGLDVYEHEPRVPKALLDMENVVLLPHIGSATLETRVAMGERAMVNLVAFFAGREPHDRIV
jgi:lactate dehydrogenase-like 2-hydroxyacid dehydrogenase